MAQLNLRPSTKPKKRPEKFKLEFTEDELKVIWHRLNASDYSFKKMYEVADDNEYQNYNEIKHTEHVAHAIWIKISPCIGYKPYVYLDDM